MTRKSVKFSSGLRRGLWKSTSLKHEYDDNNVPLSVAISSTSAERWSKLKVKFRFKSDSELVDYLLTLGEAQPDPSLSPDYEPDDLWYTSNSSKRKKRGPSLRAVLLRRSTRKNGSKSDCLSESIECDEFQAEDSYLSVEDSNNRVKISEDDTKNTKLNGYNKLLSKKRFHTGSGSHRASNNEYEKEVKANQLNAELALIVESVALQPQESEKNESELYDFKEDASLEKKLVCNTIESNNSQCVAKTNHRRWKSYHKDKRKWKQSYAAVLKDDVNEDSKPKKLKPRDEGSSSCKSEKDKRIFKSLKKNRILTAYLDSQNQIAAFDHKEASHLDKEDEPPVKDGDEKPDLELPSSSNRIGDGVETADTDISKVNDEEKEDSPVGKENKSKPASSEPVFIEVGERVKLKRRKKKLLQDSEEPSSNLKEENSSSFVQRNSNDPEKHHPKQKRNWKKSIINYEADEIKIDLKGNKVTSELPANSANVSSKNGVNEPLSKNTTEYKSIQVACSQKDNTDNDSHSKKSGSQENEFGEHENVTPKTKSCSECSLKHQQQPCPVQNPHCVIQDLVSFEQWQLQCQIQVRCSVIEAPRPKAGRLRRNTSGSLVSSEVEKRNRENSHTKADYESSRLYAEESLPVVLALEVINSEHGRSVIARAPISQYTKFGPLVGPRIYEKDISDESDMRHIWEVLDGQHSIYLNTEDPQKSNWLRFMRPAPEKEERNVTLVVLNKQLYFISVSAIPEGAELLYWADDHITTWSKKKNLKSSCGGCNMRFAHPLYYRTHCAVFHDPRHSLTIRKYHCKVCGEAVMGKENIMKHAADLHEGRGAYQCQFCHKFFLRLNYLEMHRTYGCSSNPHRTRPLCDFCGRYFCQPQKLKVHIKRMHSDMNEVLRDFQCKSCLKILGSRAALQRHFKEVHHRDVVVTSNCDRCGKSFQNRSNLKIHMLTHSGVKPFRCQQESCSAAFTTKQCLQFHYKKAHGLSEDSLPRIERSIAYTFDAYAGESLDGVNKSGDETKKPQRVLRKGRKSALKSRKNQHDATQTTLTENQQNTVEQSTVSVENETPEESVMSNFPIQENDPEERNRYTSISEPLTNPEASLPDNFVTVSPHRSTSSSELMIFPYGHEEKEPMNSPKTLTPLRTVSLLHHSDESYNHSQRISPMMSCHSPSQLHQSPHDSSSNQESPSMMNLSCKGHKKWLGEVIEVAEEAAAAAMRLSPRLSSSHLKRDLYDFDENKVKSKLQFLDNPLRQDLQTDGMGRSKTSTALAPFHHPESASMLVEAALDAAERDICCPNLSAKSSSELSSHSPERPNLSQPPYCVRSPSCGDLTNPSYYTSSETSHSLYPQSHSPNTVSHIIPLDAYSIPPSHLSPSRLYNGQNHPVPHQQLLTQETMSSDDEGGVDSDCNSRGECAQNLSLNDKERTRTRPDMSSMYGLSSHHSPPGYQEHEHVSLPQQTDLNFSGAMVVSSPRYHLYDLSADRLRPELAVSDLTHSNGYNSYEEMSGGSVDLSLPRSHASSDLHSSDSHGILVSSPSAYNAGIAQLPPQHGHPSPGPAHQYSSSNCMPSYSPHPYHVQRPLINSSSNSPNASPSPGPAHYHSYPAYY